MREKRRKVEKNIDRKSQSMEQSNRKKQTKKNKQANIKNKEEKKESRGNDDVEKGSSVQNKTPDKKTSPKLEEHQEKNWKENVKKILCSGIPENLEGESEASPTLHLTLRKYQ
uniref:Uncharacterized protein n=1 Tax=Octopus bimaculoides TaxID=37653 RepID=A0A0L8I3L5_OCTBM